MAFPIVDAAAGLLGLDTAASWAERLQEAAYTSPGGTRIQFLYEDVGRTTSKRTTAFEFPGVNDAYVQDNGHGSRKYPLRCVFTGNNCDKLATAFEAALLERGKGKLEHPLYGTFDVVPFGDITRRDDLKSAANQAIVEVTFWTTVDAVYPSGDSNPRSEILAALDGFDLAAAQQFTAADLASALQQANLKSTIRKTLRQVSATLQSVADSVESVNREFRDLQSLVNFGLDVLVGQPLLLAQQIANLITAPARALAGIRSRLDAYRNLLNQLLGNSRSSSADRALSANQRIKAQNDFRVADLSASSAVAGSVLSVLENEFTTKTEAIEAANEIAEQLDTLSQWREQRFEELELIDTGESYQALQRAVALATGLLVEVSFSLVPERSIVLDRPRTIIDLAAELYGEVDERLDFLISSNNLSGSDILLLEPGRRILYYA